MLEKRRIRSQMYFGVAMLLVIIAVLSISSFHGSLKFRKLIKSARGRAYEMPLVADLSVKISDLRSSIADIAATRPCEVYQSATNKIPIQELPDGILSSIRINLLPIRNAFENYRFQLETADTDNPLGNNTEELKFVRHFDEAITKIESVVDGMNRTWIWDAPQSLDELKESVDDLQIKTGELPGDGQSQTGTLSVSLPREKRFEQMLQDLLGHPAAIVGNN